MVFLIFLIIPLIIALGSWILFKEISWKEVLVQLGVQIIFIGLLTAGIYTRNTADVEILNGRVTDKEKIKTFCSHSYSCNCHQVCTGSGKSRSCHSQCSTCHEHFYDIDWIVKTSLDIVIEIDRVDRQGLQTPARWEAVKLGEPVASQHMYTNYIKGNPQSLFQKQGLVSVYKNKLPSYPNDIYDYYRLNRLIQIGTNIPDVNSWNEQLSELNAELGSAKQVNIIIILIQGLPQEYFQALEQHWLGGKKNDAILLIGLDNNQILWSEVMSWGNEDFKVSLRNAILSIQTLDRDKVIANTREIIKTKYIRREMKDFEYLKASIQPTKGQYIFGLIFGLVLSLGLSIFFYFKDPFDCEIRTTRKTIRHTVRRFR